MSVGFLRFLHLLAMALWLGGMFATSLWTARARATGDAGLVAFAYAMARRLYVGLISLSALVSVGAGAALMFATNRPWFQPFPEHWLFQMQVFGSLAVLATLIYVVPGARTLARLAERAMEEGTEPPEFARRVKGQAIVGSLVGGLLVYMILVAALRF